MVALLKVGRALAQPVFLQAAQQIAQSGCAGLLQADGVYAGRGALAALGAAARALMAAILPGTKTPLRQLLAPKVPGALPAFSWLMKQEICLVKKRKPTRGASLCVASKPWMSTTPNAWRCYANA